MSQQSADMKASTGPFERFRAIVMVLAGALIGVLGSVPVAAQSGGAGAIVVPAFGLLGAFVGFRKRASAPFFYFTLLVLLITLSIFSAQIMVPPPTAQ